MYTLIPTVVAVVLVVLGLSYLLNAPGWLRLLRSWAAHPERLFPTGLVMLAAGVVIGPGYDNWYGTWPVFVTVLGWLIALEGAFLLLAPALVRQLVSRLSDRFLMLYTRCGGAVLAVLGGLLAWHYLR
ncbi:hypothetical protein [Elongatibacter sediminis]|uniref:DUF2065 domain-containing protein n=1 Tax=Elongatibacter sediminis TaxID=3119006 RepID=A0AAW9REW6_9GAMM